MKYRILAFFLASSLFLLFCGCKKNIVPGENNGGGGGGDSVVHDTDVYMVGVIVNPGIADTAAYWKNGVPQILFSQDSADAIANSIAVSGNDVYVTGNILYEKENAHDFSEALYWKNGVPIQLTNGTDTCLTANAIAISGNDVYIAGGSGTAFWQESPCYWKNGVAVKLGSPGVSPGYTGIGIFVSGNDVYVTGTDSNGVPVYWKNGFRVALQTNAYKEDQAIPTAIAVSGNDVYVAGNSWVNSGADGGQSINQRACYWKNGVQYELKDTGAFNNQYDVLYASSIAVSGNDVYVAGLYNNHLIYWKNNEAPVLVGVTVQNWSGLHVASSGNSVYFAGESVNNQLGLLPSYWKLGGAPIPCINTPTVNSLIEGMTVVAK